MGVGSNIYSLMKKENYILYNSDEFTLMTILFLNL